MGDGEGGCAVVVGIGLGIRATVGVATCAGVEMGAEAGGGSVAGSGLGITTGVAVDAASSAGDGRLGPSDVNPFLARSRGYGSCHSTTAFR